VVTLALLCERPMHPYEMYQLLRFRGQDKSVKVRPGTLYHVVNGLEANGLVQAVGTDREGNRPERTTYAITEQGRETLVRAVEDMLGEPQLEYPDFTVAMGEAHNIPASTVIQLLRERISTVKAALAAGEARLAKAQERGLPRRFILGGEFAVNRARADVEWLAATINDIESGAISWDAPVPAKIKESQ